MECNNIEELDAKDTLICETKPPSIKAIDNYIMTAGSKHRQIDVIEINKVQIDHNMLFGKPIVKNHDDEAESKPSEIPRPTSPE